MSVTKVLETKAFGIEEGWPTYRLRQARYYELGENVARWAQELKEREKRPCDLLDIGTWDGVTRRYIEAHPGHENVRYHAVDLFPRGKDFVYKSNDWTLHELDLEQGLPGIESDRYDVVVCEQVLEHLHQAERVFSELGRVLRLGGRLIVGVPIFPPGLCQIRRHVVPVVDKLLKVKKVRGHVQAWNKWSFIRLLHRACPNLRVETTRGFRVTSGGPLRPLEYKRWWWRFNRWLGAQIPGLCIEIQVVARKN